MTTFNEHDHPRGQAGKFTEKRHDDAPDELGFYATQRRVAVTLTLPEGSTDWDLAEVIDNSWSDADATTYGSFQNLSADVEAGAIRLDGTDGDLSSGATADVPGKRIVALFNAGSGDDPTTIAETLRDVFGDDTNITVYDEAAHLLEAAARGEVDDDGIEVPNSSRYPAEKCAACGKKPDRAIVYGDHGSMWNGACGDEHAKQLHSDDSVERPY